CCLPPRRRPPGKMVARRRGRPADPRCRPAAASRRGIWPRCRRSGPVGGMLHALRHPPADQEQPTSNRGYLFAARRERRDTDKRTADANLQAFIDTITDTVAGGEVVVISGFAKFARVDRPARMGRNPQTGEAIRIKASRRARVTPLKAFKD